MILEPQLNVASFEFRELESVLTFVQRFANFLDQKVVRIGFEREVVLEDGHLADRVDENSIATIPTSSSSISISASGSYSINSDGLRKLSGERAIFNHAIVIVCICCVWCSCLLELNVVVVVTRVTTAVVTLN